MVIKDVVSSVTDGLKGSPIALGLVLINLVFVALMLYLLQQVSSSIARRDEIISEVVKHCYAENSK